VAVERGRIKRAVDLPPVVRHRPKPKLALNFGS
jgi:hypothetical protein